MTEKNPKIIIKNPKIIIKKSFKNKLKKLILTNYLKTVCTNTGQCIAFGLEQQKVRSVFDNFTDFDHLVDAKIIGRPSANGFVLDLQYQNKNFTTNAILKSSISSTSDNLYYEYLVGLFLNKAGLTVPCFLETYHLFTYNDDALKNSLQESDGKKIDVRLFTSLTLSNCNNDNNISISDSYSNSNSNSNSNSTRGGSSAQDNCVKGTRKNPKTGMCDSISSRRSSMFLSSNSPSSSSLNKSSPFKNLSRSSAVKSTLSPLTISSSFSKKQSQIKAYPFSHKSASRIKTPHPKIRISHEHVNIDCITESCKNSEKFAILIQCIKDPITLQQFLDTRPNWNDEICNILYQVYVALDHLKEIFTHYDLHTSNVLLYTLPTNEYLTIHYNNESTGKTTTIRTRYLVKIIDYGRCYFRDSHTNSFSIIKFMDHIRCQYMYSKESNVYLHKRNWSHDLRLMSIIIARVSRRSNNILRDCIVHYDGLFGTKEYRNTRRPNDFTIYTVSHMLEYLEKKVGNHKTSSLPSHFSEYGVMTVSLTKEIGRIPLRFKRNNYNLSSEP